jgi:cell division septal protein FtsQ
MRTNKSNFFILGNSSHFCHASPQTKRLNVKMGINKISAALQFIRLSVNFTLYAARVMLYCVLVFPAVLFSEDIYSDFIHLGDFQIETITVEGNHIVSREEILSRMDVSGEDNLMNIDLRQKAESVLGISNLRTVEVKKVFPNTLNVFVTERDPVFLSGERGYLLDNDGVRLPFDPVSYNVPSILGFSYDRKGNIEEHHLSLYRTSIDVLQKFYHLSDCFSAGIKSLAASRRNIVVTFLDDKQVKVPVPFDEMDFRHLVVVYQNLTRQNIPFKSIDLTFKNVVVKQDEDEAKKTAGPRKSENSGKI